MYILAYNGHSLQPFTSRTTVGKTFGESSQTRDQMLWPRGRVPQVSQRNSKCPGFPVDNDFALYINTRALRRDLVASSTSNDLLPLCSG